MVEECFHGSCNNRRCACFEDEAARHEGFWCPVCLVSCILRIVVDLERKCSVTVKFHRRLYCREAVERGFEAVGHFERDSSVR